MTVSNRTSGRHWTNWRETCRCFPFLALRIHDNHAGYGDCNGILWGKWTVSEQSVYLVNQMRCFCVSILDCWRNFAFESSPLTLEWFWTCQQAFFLDDYSWSITHRWKQGNLWEYCQTGMFQLLPHAVSFLFVWCCCITYYYIVSFVEFLNPQNTRNVWKVPDSNPCGRCSEAFVGWYIDLEPNQPFWTPDALSRRRVYIDML